MFLTLEEGAPEADIREHTLNRNSFGVSHLRIDVSFGSDQLSPLLKATGFGGKFFQYGVNPGLLQGVCVVHIET